jgi:uncharacterized protein
MAPRLQGAATRMTIYVGDGDLWHDKPLCSEIVHRAHDRGLAGASVLKGVEGFGGTSFVYTGRLPDRADNLPAVVIIVDTDEKIRAFLPELEELVSDRLVTLDLVEVVRYVAGGTGAQ